MSSWTHAICRACWETMNPERKAVVVVRSDCETCCWCDASTRDGIYKRAEPDTTPCKGVHATGDSE